MSNALSKNPATPLKALAIIISDSLAIPLTGRAKSLLKLIELLVKQTLVDDPILLFKAKIRKPFARQMLIAVLLAELRQWKRQY
jgi:hypothetical protein